MSQWFVKCLFAIVVILIAASSGVAAAPAKSAPVQVDPSAGSWRT
jgi:hypothetical protein